MQLPPKFPGGLLIARLPAYLHVTSVSLSRSMSEAQDWHSFLQPLC